LVAEMAECGCAPGLFWEITEPVEAIKQICLDPTLKVQVATSAGYKTGLQILIEHHEAAKKHLDMHRQQAESWHSQFLQLNEEVLAGLKADPLSQRHRVSWALKKHTIESKLGGNYAKDQAMAYVMVLDRLWPKGAHASLAEAGKVERLFDLSELKAALNTPPPGRPYARSTLQRAYPGQAGGDWECIKLWVNESPMQLLRDQMKDPFGPSAEEVDFLANLGVKGIIALRLQQPAA
jgi:hypothetical protein